MSLKQRALVFAMVAAGLTASIEALVALLVAAGSGWRLVAPALVGAATWVVARRGVTHATGTIDAAVARLTAAAGGDFAGPVPAVVERSVPRLGAAMRALFKESAATIAHVEQRADVDAVTGLANRAAFRRAATERLAALAPSDAAALFFVDLDRFKAVNDNHGHARGDQLLREVADRLRHVVAAELPNATLLSRFAGDEFTLLCCAEVTPAMTQRWGDALLGALSAPFRLGGIDLSVGASIGVALRPEHGSDLAELMAAADAAMYRSKAGGRARLSRYNAGVAAEIAAMERLDREIERALARREFLLLFQPQVDLAGEGLISSEALLRWRHPQLGLRTPSAFLPRAEENGQILAIGEWTAHAIAQAAAYWERRRNPGRLALNLGARQLEDGSFLAALQQAFAAAAAPLDRLEVEVSEGVLVRCGDASLDMLEQLRAGGATVALDDYGAGESSVQRLRTMPLDRVKIDASLVAAVADDPAARAILQALIGLVHGLGCTAVAEGVSAAHQIDLLRVLGCDAVQGAAVAAPMPLGELERWERARGGFNRLSARGR